MNFILISTSKPYCNNCRGSFVTEKRIIIIIVILSYYYTYNSQRNIVAAINMHIGTVRPWSIMLH